MRSEVGWLAGAFRDLEWIYEEDFSGIQISRGPLTSKLLSKMGTVAAAANDELFLSPAFYALSEKGRFVVLAHELAHVVQKRRFDGNSARAVTVGRRQAIEKEAHEAARAALRGHRVICRIPDDPAIVAPWGYLGHYYTSYFVMRAAGADDVTAQRRAFFCQMPDQVKEFDASCACRDYYQSADASSLLDLPLSGALNYMEIDRANPPDRIVLKTQERETVFRGTIVRSSVQIEDPAAKALRLQEDLDVSEGLHSLTGRGCNNETDFRSSLLYKTRNDDLDYGLALHSYGDSYAHRDLSHPTQMYQPLRGHAHHVHEPDSVVRQGSLYINYARSLYKIARETLPVRNSAIPVDRAMALLGSLTDMVFDSRESEEKAQTVFIKGLFKQNFGGMINYSPDTEPSMYWNQFWAGHRHTLDRYGGRVGVYRRVRSAAASWAKQRPAWDTRMIPMGIKG